MHIDISNHNLVRAWFKISPIHKLKNKKETYKNLSWIKKDEESFEKFKNHFRKLIGKKDSFNKYMKKSNTTLKSILFKRKRIKVEKKGNKILLAAKWVDKELIENLKNLEVCKAK